LSHSSSEAIYTEVKGKGWASSFFHEHIGERNSNTKQYESTRAKMYGLMSYQDKVRFPSN
jgi:hypothetical protein